MKADKYLNSYKNWQRYQRNKKLLLTYIIILAFFWILFVSILVIVKHDLITVFNTSFLVLIFTWLFYFISANLFIQNDIDLKEVIIFSALSTSDELSRGDFIKSSVTIDKLIHALSQILNYDKITFVDETFPIKKLLSINPDQINKKSIHKYLQLKENCNEISGELNKLVNSLINSTESNYLAIQRFLVFLNNNVADLMLPSKMDYLIKISPILSLLSPFQLIK